MRISPNQINIFRQEPMLWCFRYFGNYRQPDNAKMAAGRAAGMAAQEWAIKAIEAKDIEGRANEIFESQRDMAWTDYPNAGLMAVKLAEEFMRQDKNARIELPIETELEGVLVTGFADIVFHDEALELKTSSKLMTTKSYGEQVQCAIYREALKVPVKIIRATEKKSITIETDIEQHNKIIAYLRPTIRAMRPYLEAKDSRDTERMMRLMRGTPINDTESYLWDSGSLSLLDDFLRDNFYNFINPEKE